MKDDEIRYTSKDAEVKTSNSLSS